ncbi:Ig-like domain-containing protein [Undibacterium flavidum]|uniref:Big-1 domain-containing protein n=1 Tax=Undibacterium flavidum TaxID=2762297 RepID=A0ABR6YEG2_9BURK|nr:hypothetical protein [Undibacterium flavidum]MBC3874917.1 hypothetical protein [Undibacterium flavidum]
MSQIIRRLCLLLQLILLTACGGGGVGVPAVQNDTTQLPNGAISLNLVRADGGSGNSFEIGKNFVAKVVVTGTDGKPAPNVVVSFALRNSFATFNPASGTALTDAAGQAQITLTAGSQVGATTLAVQAKLANAAESVKAEVPFAVIAGTGVVLTDGQIQLALSDKDGIKTNVLSGTNTLVARATVLNNKGLPAPNVVVYFSVDTAIVSLQPASATALTNAEGVAIVNLAAGTGPGAGTLFATANVTGNVSISTKATFAVSPNTNNNSPEGKIQLSLLDLNGAPSNLISATNSLSARASLVNQLGVPAANVVVTYTLDSGIASLLPTSGTALTDANGVAQISLKPGVGSGAGSITATATIVGSQPISAKASFQVGAPASAIPAAVNFIVATPSNNSIVIQGAGGNGRTEIALLKFQVVDSSNVGIANTKLNFSIQSTETVSLVATSGITDGAGMVTAVVHSGSKPTTLRIVGTVDGMPISAISDTVTVTTGLPTQTHFGIHVENYVVEGFDFGGTRNVISVMLADANGGVVANGTPVVFTTDSGAIIGDNGSSDNARCLTQNGQCQVVWRSQTPAKPVVTIVATTTDGSSSLSTSAWFINSASSGNISGVPASVNFSAANCVPQTFDLTVSDRNGYVMPTGTTLTLQDPITVTGSIFEASVMAPFAIAPFLPVKQGTMHTLTLMPVANCPAGTGHIFVQMKSPLGVSSNYRINVNYL